MPHLPRDPPAALASRDPRLSLFIQALFAAHPSGGAGTLIAFGAYLLARRLSRRS